MEAWQDKRSVHIMNLRSVFTAEQQRILERYYKNGMTNQSKSCFQLILQCAQEAKLDFSVVRTWVGNKRRKLASKAEKNGMVGLSNHAIVSASGALVVSPVLSSELAAVRSVQHGPAVAHLLPHPSSCPSSSSSSTSSSPSSNGLKINNDVIVTGAYSLQRATNRLDTSSQSRMAAKVVPLSSNPEPSLHSRLGLHPDVASLQRKSPQVHNPSTLILNQMRKPILHRDLAPVPPSWAKQYGAPQIQPWPAISHQQTSANLHRTPPASPADSGVRIQQVFTIAGLTESSPRPSPGTSQDHGVRKINTPSSSETFSIAMETGDADDEYSREEELANMGALLHLSKSTGGTSAVEDNRSSTGEPHQTSNQGVHAATVRSQLHGGHDSPNSALFGKKGCQTNSPLLLGTHGSFPVSETSPSRVPDLKESMMSAPWLLSNSRKRTLQDRTQFSDGDLYALKRYWDNGMTSLGSVCREKISAASTELNVDGEIVKTWIGNRRRKYRLMGIEIPPPKGGPVTFPKVAGTEPPPSSSPEEDRVRCTAPPQDGEQSDAASICLSEDGASDSYLKDNEDMNDGSNSSVLNENMKIEIIDDEDDDGHDGDVMVTDMEQMQSFLEYKQEEVQYLESELESQKNKYHELIHFTKHLLTALKNNDTEKQQELLSSLPHHIEDDMAAIQQDVEMNCGQKDSSASEGDRGTESV